MKDNFKPYPKPGGKLTKIKPKAKKVDSAPRLKSQPGYIRCIFTLTHSSYRIIQKCLEERHLGINNYDQALQLILQEWKQMKDRQHHPVLIAVPADMLPRQDQSTEEE